MTHRNRTAKVICPEQMVGKGEEWETRLEVCPSYVRIFQDRGSKTQHGVVILDPDVMNELTKLWREISPT